MSSAIISMEKVARTARSMSSRGLLSFEHDWQESALHKKVGGKDVCDRGWCFKQENRRKVLLAVLSNFLLEVGARPSPGSCCWEGRDPGEVEEWNQLPGGGREDRDQGHLEAWRPEVGGHEFVLPSTELNDLFPQQYSTAYRQMG